MAFTMATWNVNSLRVRLPQVLQWLDTKKPSLLALQETKITDDQFPVKAFEDAGYSVVYAGQPTYNGVAIVSPSVLDVVATDFPQWKDEQKRFLAVNVGDIHVINVYVPNGASVDSEKYIYKLKWLSHLQAYVAHALQQYKHVVLLGDFNIAPEDGDVHDPVSWAGKLLCSEAERAALEGILALGLKDNFRLFEQPEATYSWWDYRTFAFKRNRGLRIDLILSSLALAARCEACTVDVEPRGWSRPSDHAPVLAYFANLAKKVL